MKATETNPRVVPLDCGVQLNPPSVDFAMVPLAPTTYAQEIEAMTMSDNVPALPTFEESQATCAGADA
jgi:hypothetical protein